MIRKKIDLNTVGRGVSVQTSNVSTQAEVTSGNDVSTQTTTIASTTLSAQDQNMLPTPIPPPVTLGTQSNPSASVPPPPPPPMPPEGLKNWNPSKNNPTGEKPSVGTTQKNTPPPKKLIPSGVDEQKNEELLDELLKKIASRRNGITGKQENDVQQSNKLKGVYDKISNMIPPPSHSSSVSSNGSEESEQDWSNDEDKYQLDNKKRRDSSDSDYGSGSELTSPSNPVPKAGKPPVPPKPANLQTKPEAPLVNKESDVSSVNSKVQNLSVKDRCGVFGEMVTKFERELLVR